MILLWQNIYVSYTILCASEAAVHWSVTHVVVAVVRLLDVSGTKMSVITKLQMPENDPKWNAALNRICAGTYENY